jgi:uncharacterized damage-inducible protein DinB
MNSADFKTLFRYNVWANRRTVEACATLTGEQFTRDVESSFRSVRDTLVHIMAVEQIWLARWRQTWDGSFLQAADFSTLESVRNKWKGIETDLLAYVDGLSDEDTARVIAHKTMTGAEFSMPLHEMLQHLANHGTYHRGQMTTLIRQVGGKPLATDLIGFYRAKPEIS